MSDEYKKARGILKPYIGTDERAEMQAAIVELREELEGIVYHYHPEGRHQNDLSNAKKVLNNTKKWSEHDQ